MKKTARFIFAICFSIILATGFLASTAGASTDEVPYVYDGDGVITEAQRLVLDNRAKSLSEKYRCDVRIFVVSDMRGYGYQDILDLQNYFYSSLYLGYGYDRNCVLLTLSIDDRDFDLAVWGDRANNAFTLYGIDNILDKHILPRLGNNEYYAAFQAFLGRAEDYFEMAENGKPFDARTDTANIRAKLIPIALASLLIAFLACTIMKNSMKTATLAKTAHSFIPAGGFTLTAQGDQFLYMTTARTRIQSNSSSSNRASSNRSGGSSGRSGKF